MRSFQAVLATSLRVDATGRAQLLPAGEFAARDGRPGPGKKWKLSDATGVAIATAMNAVAAATPIVIDYDHQTLYVQANGQPAPAAGWIGGGVTWTPGEGLHAQVDWTAPAKQRIGADEYRYISPVITYTEDGTVTGVALAALTNFPAILGMEPVIAQLSTQFAKQEPATMNPTLVALIAALGLAATTTEADALSAVGALKAERDQLKAKPLLPAALVTELGLAAGADEAAALTAVKTLKTADDKGLVALVGTLQGQLTALTAQVQGDQVTLLVEGAIEAGKLTAAQRESYVSLGRKDVALLRTLLDAAPVIPGLKGQSAEQHHQNEGGSAALTASQRLIAQQLGLDPKKYAEQLKAQA